VDAPRRDRLLIWISVVTIVALAWAYLIHLDRQMAATMASDAEMARMGMAMDAAPWTAADVWFTFAMWAVMMAGMMTPSAAPVFLLFAGAQARQAGGRAGVTVPAFASGYLAVWSGFSGGAAVAQWWLHEHALLSPMMAASSAWLAGAILIGAGLYQFSHLKTACLTHCQSPLGFLMTNWRAGVGGAFRMGVRHGLYCLGCCWALMAVLFAVGVMNLIWVAAITGFVLVEKVVPARGRVARGAGIAMIAGGLFVLIRSAL
jgi:predicted metal-binding membrane protein